MVAEGKRHSKFGGFQYIEKRRASLSLSFSNGLEEEDFMYKSSHVLAVFQALSVKLDKSDAMLIVLNTRPGTGQHHP